MSQIFEQALVAKFNAITELTALLGTWRTAPAIFYNSVPQTYDYGANGVALTYLIPTKPRGHVLTGSDGTATPRVQVNIQGYAYVTIKQAIEALWNGIDGPPNTAWGDGTCIIMSVVQQDDADMPAKPMAGTDQWLYDVMQEYNIKYRVAIPSLV